MLTSRAYGVFICLRCELRIVRPRTLVASLPQRSKFSTAPRPDDGSAELEALSRAQQPELKITRETRPRDRIRRRRGKVIRETSAPLSGLKTLGRDANILVLREVETDPPIDQEEATPQLSESQAVPDLIASLREEGKTLTSAELYKQIESLRPKNHDADEQHLVTQAIFTKLTRLLNGGFTQEQLSRYYADAKKEYRKKGKTTKIAQGHGKQQILVNRTEWQQGTSSSTKRLLASSSGSKLNRRSTGKSRLVDGILRDIWNLVLIDEAEGLGELELTFWPWMLPLLTTGGHGNLLNRIGKLRRAKLEVFWHDNVLRITADKNAAEYAANDVENLIRDWQIRTLDLEPWLLHLEEKAIPKDHNAHALYTEQDLKSVMSMANVHLQWRGAHTLSIRGLDGSAVAEAERVLLGLLSLRSSVIRSVDSQRINGAQTAYMVPISQKEGLANRKHREDTMGRWLLPIPRQSAADLPGVAEETEKTNGHLDKIMEQASAALQQPSFSANELRIAARETKKVSYWGSKFETKLTAKFGQALFSIEEMTVNSGADKAILDSSINDMTFSYPGLAHLLASQEFVKASHIPSPSLVYDLIPAPKQTSLKSDQVIPAAEVRMRLNAGGNSADLLRLCLYFQEYNHDVLLPDLVSDIRFAQIARLSLINSRKDSHIEGWVNTVRANIESGSRLTAPPLELAVPKWTISGFPLDAFDTTPVQYLFSGVRISSSLSGKLLGTNLVYTTTQSGKSSPQGGRLNAYYECPSHAFNSEELDREARHVFMRNCVKIAEKLTVAAGNTEPPKMRKLRVQNGERRVKRQEKRAAVSNEGSEDELRGEESLKDEEGQPNRSEEFGVDQRSQVDGLDSSRDANQSDEPFESALQRSERK